MSIKQYCAYMFLIFLYRHNYNIGMYNLVLNFQEILPREIFFINIYKKNFNEVSNS